MSVLHSEYSMCLFLPTQKLTKAAVEILESQLTASGRGRVFVTETDCTLSVCPPLSWSGRRTSLVRKTTSGRLRNPAVFVSSWDALRCSDSTCAVCPHMCMSTAPLMWVHKCVTDECREGCIINGQIIPTVCLAEAVDFETIGGLIS